jgi:cell division protein DivIC
MKKKTKNRFNTIIVSLVLLAGTVFLLIPVVEEIGNTIRLSETLEEVKAELIVLEQENSSLEEQKTKLLDPEYVKSYARANYMLTKEGEQIYYLPKDDE